MSSEPSTPGKHEVIRLLSVEDNPGDARLLRAYLADAGATQFEFLCVERLAEALERVANEAIDVLLVDLSLPDGHGLDNVRRLRAIAAHVPIIVLTGNDDESLAVEALQAGAQDYIVKGDLDSKLLVRSIRYAMERTQVLQELSESEERFRSAISAMQEGLILIDAETTILLFNRSAAQILGVSAEQMIGRKTKDIDWRVIQEDGSDLPHEEYLMHVALRTGQTADDMICGVYRPDGELIWLLVNATPLFRPGDDKPYGVVTTFSDITERRNYEQQLKAQMLLLDEARHDSELQQKALRDANEKLERLATTDGLTDLKNHRAFQERLQTEFRRAQRYNIPLSLLMLDVDKFKAYNDTFGHPAGDGVLQQVAQLLLENIRDTDFVARYGGEEFVVLLPNTDYPYANFLAERLRIAIEEATWQGAPVTASFGIATLTPQLNNSAALIAAADKALYYSKANGRNRVTHIQEVGVPIASAQ
ncbi:MAG: diguanylate cyclase [Abitibacteriaceae bacterium]|nr:diguanylate cyclase [Abditibacteriaceae bacterium]